MQRLQLEHVIRAAAGITDANEILLEAPLCQERLALAVARFKRLRAS
jgi:hypothetical protein